nr:MAG TPA: hypothetical protein [Caudoviricetes sp.]
MKCYAVKGCFRGKRYKYLALLILVSEKPLIARLIYPLLRNIAV